MSIKDDFPSSSICKLQNQPAWRNLGSPNTKPLYRNIPRQKIDFFKLEVYMRVVRFRTILDKASHHFLLHY